MTRGSLRPVVTMFASVGSVLVQKLASLVLSSTAPCREYTVKEPLSIWITWPGPTEAPMSGGVRVHGDPQAVPWNCLAISPPPPLSCASDGIAESMISRHDHN